MSPQLNGVVAAPTPGFVMFIGRLVMIDVKWKKTADEAVDERFEAFLVGNLGRLSKKGFLSLFLPLTV